MKIPHVGYLVDSLRLTFPCYGDTVEREVQTSLRGTAAMGVCPADPRLTRGARKTRGPTAVLLKVTPVPVRRPCCPGLLPASYPVTVMFKWACSWATGLPW